MAAHACLANKMQHVVAEGPSPAASPENLGPWHRRGSCAAADAHGPCVARCILLEVIARRRVCELAAAAAF